MSKVWTGSKCPVLAAPREAKSLDHLAEYIPLSQFGGEVVVPVQQARHRVTVAVAGGERVGHLLSPPR